jgi:hypothetical protein
MDLENKLRFDLDQTFPIMRPNTFFELFLFFVFVKQYLYLYLYLYHYIVYQYHSILSVGCIQSDGSHSQNQIPESVAPSKAVG